VKRLLIALALGTAVFAAVFAAAATLGLTAEQLGAGDRAVTSCSEGLNVSYDTAYVPGATTTELGALGRYRITNVHLEGLDTTACAGQKINLILTDEAGNILSPLPSPDPELGPATKIFTCCGTDEGAGGVLNIADRDIDPRLVYSVHVVITGQSNPPPSAQP